MKRLLISATVLLLSACRDDTPDYEIKPSNSSVESAVRDELEWAPLSVRQMTWRQAYAYCDTLAADRSSWWRLASAKELYALKSFRLGEIGAGPGPDIMWSSLIHENGNHHSVNMNNGAKNWGSEERSGYVMCVKGYSAVVDPESWIMELYNARLMKNAARAFAVSKRMAEAGSPEGQLELGNAYLRGEGIPQDLAAARKWYRKASDQGQAYATANLERLNVGTLRAEPTTAPQAAAEPRAPAEPAAPTADDDSIQPQAETAPDALVAQQAASAPPLSGTGIRLMIPVPGKPGQELPIWVMLSPLTREGEQAINNRFQEIKTTSLKLLRAQPFDSFDSDVARSNMSKQLLELLNRQLGGQLIEEISIEHTDPGIG